ncbi:MAG: MarR family transcriptional regulator [Pseudomonadota bacterium]
MTARQLRIFHKLSLVSHRLQKLADQRISEVSTLTTAQAAVLSALNNKEAETQKEIARALGLNESAITAMMTRLIRSGYIERQRSKTDRRAWTLSITPLGEAALAETRLPFSHINQLLEATLSVEELRSLSDYLERLQQALEEIP